MSTWDSEYSRRGIPSSSRDDPSGVLTWTLTNWSHLTGGNLPSTAIDIGCGTGRNAMHMASRGISVLAFDSSETAVQSALERRRIAGLPNEPTFLKHDLTQGIPAQNDEFDLATDIFVYKHQLKPELRAEYRQELRRVLRPEGRLLLSLADRRDGYYDKCPDLDFTLGNPHTILDPVAGIGSVLFTLEELREELSDVFALEMSWHKVKFGLMHGERYLRRTIATIWRIRGQQDAVA